MWYTINNNGNDVLSIEDVKEINYLGVFLENFVIKNGSE